MKLSKEDQQALKDQKWWKQFERDGWKCYGFTYRQSALFCKDHESIDVTWQHIELLTPERLA